MRLTIAALAEAIATARQTRVPRHADASRVPTGTVEYNGTKFRSLAEARWAVFFHTVGLNYEYETKRCDVYGVSRLPDFWLPELGFWFEVKVDEPTDEDKDLCQRLAVSSDHVVLMAIGAPEPRDQLLAFFSMGYDR